jgi:DNA-binding response OmpR family regulator
MDTLTLMQILLERDGYEVKYTAGKDEAIRLAGDFTPDLIIIDIAQKEIIPVLKKYGKENYIPILLMTGYSEREMETESLVDDIIEKPFEFDLLLNKIEEQLKMTG